MLESLAEQQLFGNQADGQTGESKAGAAPSSALPSPGEAPLSLLKTLPEGSNNGRSPQVAADGPVLLDPGARGEC